MDSILPELKDIAAWLIDMDGVLWRGDQAMPGLTMFFETLREQKRPFMLVTNNAKTSPTHVQMKLHSFGVKIETAEVLTSAMAASAFLEQFHPEKKRAFVIGEAPLHEELEQTKVEISPDAQGVQVVVVGLDSNADYSDLAEASYAIKNGALFLGTNPDKSFPTERGLAPGNGALLAAIEATTGCSPVIVGKPEPFLYQEAMNRLNANPELTLALGDRLETDILGGQRVNMRTGLILTGVTSRSDLEASDITPDWVFDDLPSIVEILV